MDFTISASEALQKGRELWKVTATRPDAIPYFRKAVELGSHDDQTLQSLSWFFGKYGRYRDMAEVYETLANAQSDWKGRIRYLKRALACFFGASDMEACVRCHREAISLLPSGLSPRQQLDMWRPAGVARAYPPIGAAREALSQITTLGAAVGDEGSIWERSHYHLALSRIYGGLGEWDKAIAEGRKFVDWAVGIPKHDSILKRQNLSFDGETDDELTGEIGRWYCICGTLTEVIAEAEHSSMNDTSATLEELNRSLTSYEQLMLEAQHQSEQNPDDSVLKSNAEMFRARVAMCFDKAGVTAHQTEHYEEAIRYFNREMDLDSSHQVDEPVYRAASCVALGRIEEAKSYLSAISGWAVTSGRALTRYEQLKRFDSIREDPQVIKIIDGWKQAMAVGQK